MTRLSAELLDRFRAGHGPTLHDLIVTYTPLLFDWMAGLGVPAPDRDDLVQEVWMRVLSKREQYSGSGSFRGWLYRVSRNIALDRFRAESRRAAREREAAHTDPSSGAPPPAGVADVERLIEGLTDRQRQIVLMRVVEGLSTRECAEVLGCAPGTIKATLSQSLQKLRERLRSEIEPQRMED